MILIALGSSLPFCRLEPPQIIRAARAALGRIADIKAVSRLYISPAWPDSGDPPFINAAAALATDLRPEALLAALHAIEAGFGRRRGKPNSPRTLDLDLVDYEGRVRSADALSPLILPHPRLAERDFVLVPLLEVAPDWVCPATGASGRVLLEALGASSVRALNP